MAFGPLKTETDGLSDSIGNLENSFRSVQSEFVKLSQQVSGVTDKYGKLEQVLNGMASDWVSNKKFTQESTQAFVAHAKSLQSIEKEYKQAARAAKALSDVSRPLHQQLISLASSAGGASKSAIGLTGTLTGLKLGHKDLTAEVLRMNKAMFEGTRIADRYGESSASLNASLEKIKHTTAITQQGFAELNQTFKELYLGIPPTSAAIADLAESFTGRLGYAEDQIIDKTKQLISLQNKLPDLFDRITAAQDAYKRSSIEGEKASGKLYFLLKSLGSSRSEIENVMNAMQPPSSAAAGFMTFEKSIAKSRQEIQDTNLLIGQKTQPLLAGIETTSAMAAKAIGGLGGNFMMLAGGMQAINPIIATTTVAIQAMTAAALRAQMLPGVLLASGKGAADAGKAVVRGGSGTATAATTAAAAAAASKSGAGGFLKGRGGSFLKGGAAGIGVGILGELAGGGLERYGDNTDPSKAPSTGRAAMGALGTATKWGARGAALGSFGGSKGMMIGGALGALGGLAFGSFREKKEFEDANAQLGAARQEYGAQMGVGAMDMGRQMESAGMSGSQGEMIKATKGVTDEIKKTAIIRSTAIRLIKNETDEGKKTLAVQRLIQAGLVSRKDLRQMLTLEADSEAAAEKKIEKAIEDAARAQLRFSNITQMVGEAMGAQITQLQIAKGFVGEISNGYAEAAKKLASQGILAEGLSDALQSGLTAARHEAALTAREVEMQMVSAFAAIADEDPFKEMTGPLPDLFRQMSASSRAAVKPISEEFVEAKKHVQHLVTAMSNLQQEKLSAKGDVEAIAAVEEKIQDLKKELGEAHAAADKLGASGFKKMVDSLSESGINLTGQALQDVFKAAQVQYKELEAAVNSGEGTDQMREQMEALLPVIRKMSIAMGDMLEASVKPMAEEIKVAESTYDSYLQSAKQATQYAVLQKDVIESAQLGLAKGYQAHVDAVALMGQELDILDAQAEKHDEIGRKISSNAGMQIDWNAAVKGGAGYAQQIYEAMLGQGKTQVEAQGVQTAVLQLSQAMLGNRTETLNKTKQQLDLTKQFREGYLDAMTEMVANAGDFAAIVGTQTRGATQLIAAGAIGTMKYGGVNQRDVGDEERRGEFRRRAPRYYAEGSSGGLSADIRVPAALHRYSDLSGPNSIEGARRQARNYERNLGRDGRARAGTAYAAGSNPTAWSFFDKSLESAAQGGRGGYVDMDYQGMNAKFGRGDLDATRKSMSGRARSSSAVNIDGHGDVGTVLWRASSTNQEAADKMLRAANQIAKAAGVEGRAYGGSVNTGDYVVKTSMAQNPDNKKTLNSIPGVKWVNQGRGGVDDVRYDVAGSGGGIGGPGIIAMRGEAIVPRSSAALAESINNGYAEGGSVEDYYGKIYEKAYGKPFKRVQASRGSSPERIQERKEQDANLNPGILKQARMMAAASRPGLKGQEAHDKLKKRESRINEWRNEYAKKTGADVPSYDKVVSGQLAEEMEKHPDIMEGIRLKEKYSDLPKASKAVAQSTFDLMKKSGFLNKLPLLNRPSDPNNPSMAEFTEWMRGVKGSADEDLPEGMRAQVNDFIARGKLNVQSNSSSDPRVKRRNEQESLYRDEYMRVHKKPAPSKITMGNLDKNVMRKMEERSDRLAAKKIRDKEADEAQAKANKDKAAGDAHAAKQKAWDEKRAADYKEMAYQNKYGHLSDRNHWRKLLKGPGGREAFTKERDGLGERQRKEALPAMQAAWENYSSSRERDMREEHAPKGFMQKWGLPSAARAFRGVVGGVQLAAGAIPGGLEGIMRGTGWAADKMGLDSSMNEATADWLKDRREVGIDQWFDKAQDWAGMGEETLARQEQARTKSYEDIGASGMASASKYAGAVTEFVGGVAIPGGAMKAVKAVKAGCCSQT
jgi:hypothetical protein